MRKRLLLMFVLPITFLACSEEIGHIEDVNPETVYQEYHINVGAKNVEGTARLRFAGPNGTTLLLDKPSELQFQGEKMAMDSSNGVVYSAVVPKVSDTLTIVFHHVNQKVYQQKVSIARPELPQDLALHQHDSTHFYLLMPPSVHSATLSWLDENGDERQVPWDKENGGLLELSEEDQSFLRENKGEVSVSVHVVSVFPLQQATQEGGQIWVSHRVNKSLVMTGLAKK